MPARIQVGSQMKADVPLIINNPRLTRTPLVIGGAITLALISALVPIVAETLAPPGGRNLQSIGATFRWEPILVGIHLVTDLLIGLAYVAISLTLIYLARRARQDIPFLWAFVAFGLFIISCGVTHFMAALTLWAPLYWVAASVKDVTALASVGTAVVLPSLVPKVLALVQTAKVSEERRTRLEHTNTELEALTSQLTEINAIRTRFFATVSHELRTPLALILGPVEQMLATDELSAGQRRDLAVVDRNARTLLQHVNDLLDVARLDAGRMDLQYVDSDIAWLVRVSASHFDVLARDRHINFTVQVVPTLPARVDVEKLQRILLNLLGNAFKFSPPGGAVHLHLAAQDNHVAISVEDTGPGVPPALREAIFEPFRQGDDRETRRHGGTGLGLAIVKQLVDLQGGSVTVDTAPGGGARFQAILPLLAPTGTALVHPTSSVDVASAASQPVPSAADMPASAPDQGAVAVHGPLVLVVEDNQDMNRYIADILRTRYRTVSAFSGEQGLVLALTQRPSLIITDLMMPHMSGSEFVQALRQHHELAGTPIVVITARTDDHLSTEMLNAGAQDYLTKPFSAAELRARAGNLIEMKRTRDLLQHSLASQRMDLEELVREIIERRQEAEAANQSKNEFLSNAAHELMTPLTALLGNIEMAELQIRRSGDLTGTPALTAALQSLQRAHLPRVRLLRLIEDLLDIARIETEALATDAQPCDITALVHDAVVEQRELDATRTINLHLPDGSVPPILADAGRIRQVLSNYVNNARKYAPPDRPITVAVWPRDDAVRVTVQDEGPGIPPAEQDRIWERSYRVAGIEPRSGSHIGLGLGLAICRGIVTSHHGQVGVDSIPGHGATFWFELPYYATPPRASD
jgi:signal transduction histidine kinase